MASPAPSIDFSNLVQYTDQLAMPLLREAVFEGTTIQKISTFTGIKFTDSINVMVSTPVLQAGGCGTISPTGSVVPKQVALNVCPVKIEEAICIDILEQYWLGMMAKKGSWNETAPNEFNEAYNADKQAKIAKNIEFYAWQGDTGGTYNASYTLCDGLLHQLLLTSASQSAYYTSITASGGTTSLQTGALTSTNAIATVDNMLDVMATSVVDIFDKEDLYIFMSIPNYRTYIRAWRDRGNGNGNYWVDAEESKNLEFTIPGTNVKVVGTVGLNGLNKMVLTFGKNLYFGTDLQSDYEQYMTWFERRDNQVYFRAKWKMGFNVAYPQYCVIYNG